MERNYFKSTTLHLYSCHIKYFQISSCWHQVHIQNMWGKSYRKLFYKVIYTYFLLIKRKKKWFILFMILKLFSTGFPRCCIKPYLLNFTFSYICSGESFLIKFYFCLFFFNRVISQCCIENHRSLYYHYTLCRSNLPYLNWWGL